MNITIGENEIRELNCWRIQLNNKPNLLAKALDNPKTMVIAVDMVNGFCCEGALYSDRLKKLILPVRAALSLLENAVKVFLCDAHTDNSVEFKSYPKHCADKKESAVVKELSAFPDRELNKNSTNGFFSLISAYPKLSDFTNFVILGDCTDICVMQLALTLRAYLNEINNPAAVSVFTDYTDTFDSTFHNANLNNLFALKNMDDNGIGIFKSLC